MTMRVKQRPSFSPSESISKGTPRAKNRTHEEQRDGFLVCTKQSTNTQTCQNRSFTILERESSIQAVINLTDFSVWDSHTQFGILNFEHNYTASSPIYMKALYS